MDKWIGKVAVVTGASSGIGAAVCKVLVQNGVKVIGAARRVDPIKDLSEKLKEFQGSLTPMKCDVTVDQEVIALFDFAKEKFGGVDICINNAGMSFNHGLLDGKPDEWRHMMNVNVIGLCLCTKLAVASMRERDFNGHIININSIAGYQVLPFSHGHFYSATKYAVRATTEGLRQELRELGKDIRVSEICPGMVETGFFETMNSSQVNDWVHTVNKLQPEDIAAAVIHMLSAPPHVEVNDIILRPVQQEI